MEVTTPLASLPYKEQIKKKQREVVQLLQQLEEVSSIIIFSLFLKVPDLHGSGNIVYRSNKGHQPLEIFNFYFQF
jgi:hypothetical protein